MMPTETTRFRWMPVKNMGRMRLMLKGTAMRMVMCMMCRAPTRRDRTESRRD